ncbi:LysR family transcriptional regulator [Kribbella sandramycini]|uniref:DNA-binding transcriptional LysR family regulator n=1 Tax=Kribbella sandramycini TaxID=60450 RepID=A0A7Y4NYL8_9ACTN|nr:LysR family transcriptional regulator [Kribbella sandramycini]MBB6568359.1 DNA-binding transcriptional LysR family regulator [Kribbella sandramycini]NOL39049.1 LysR family transcriptional regulator [Kribbella sandramycini]
MNVELRHLRVVVLVAEAGSVGRAARWLKVSQPSLTAQLKRIEAAFGGELFERSRTGVTPTALGRYAVDRARAILVDVDHLAATVSAMTAVESSAVRLGGFPTAPMSGIASRLREHGEIEQVSIEVEWSTSVLLQQLESGRLDFALLREFPGFELRLPTGVEAVTVVESESAYVVMSADHPIARKPGAEVELGALADEEWIGEPPDDSGFHVLFRAACEQAGFQPKVEHHSVDTSVLMGFVTSGQGVALVSPTSYRLLSTDVITRPLVGDPIHRRLLLAWSTESPRSQMAPDVLHMATAAYEEAVAAQARHSHPTHQMHVA